MLLINEIKMDIREEESSLKRHIEKKLKIHNLPFTYRIQKKSLDARKGLFFVYSLLVDIENEKKYLSIPKVSLYEEMDLSVIPVHSDIRPIIIGYGPAGIFAALRLAEAGLCPIVFEKGKRIKERKKDVELFFKEGIFNPFSNVQYGEGGAGTFSDAKLTTRVKNPFISYITDTFIRYGAEEKIAYEAHPHIGTEKIMDVISSLTDDLISKGVEFHFEEEVKELILKDKVFKGVRTDKREYYSDYGILAAGHSAYPLVQRIHEQGVYVEAKDLAIGFRVEHPQNLIDENQYKGIHHPRLEPSEYFLRYNRDEKGVYSFCMCPGGYVIPASSDEHTIVTNGMSYSKRDNSLANSAILVQVNKEEFPRGPLGGYEYLHNLEKKAYDISRSYRAPSQNISDYLNNRVHELHYPSSYPLGTVLFDFNSLFNDEQNILFKEAIVSFNRQIPGFLDGIMVGPETRSSSPVRITRDISLESVSTPGLYPCGEGSGYGGGIMSCGLDGIRIADQILKKLSHISV